MTIKVSLGDLVLLAPSSGDRTERLGRGLVIGIDPPNIQCVMVTDQLPLATERDLILAPPETGMPYSIVVHTMGEAFVDAPRIRKIIGHVEQVIVAEVRDCRYSDPSGKYVYGDYLLPVGDYRDRHLTERIREFIRSFGPSDRGRTIVISQTQDPDLYEEALSRVRSGPAKEASSEEIELVELRDWRMMLSGRSGQEKFEQLLLGN